MFPFNLVDKRIEPKCAKADQEIELYLGTFLRALDVRRFRQNISYVFR